jgi:aminocarboxymuconate-semialdehyde decarboxylase
MKDVAGAMAGIASVSSSFVNASQAQASERSPNAPDKGSRLKTVDMHAHVAIPEAMVLIGRAKALPASIMTPISTMMPARLKVMDEQEIDVEVLNISPYWYAAERDLARQITRIQNEKLAELCAARPDRFVAFASVVLQYPDLAVEQLEEAVKKLGMRGVSIGGSVNGANFSDPKFNPFWAKAEELGILIFIHPTGIPELNKRLSGNGVLNNVIGNPLETAIALAHLIFEGTLDRFPGLKIFAAHGGGYLPSYAARMDHGCLANPDQCTIELKKRPTEYLKQMFYVSIVFTSEGLRHLVAEVGASQVVMGTDYPYPWTKTAVDHIRNTKSLSDNERAAILSNNAARLLGIKV